MNRPASAPAAGVTATGCWAFALGMPQTGLRKIATTPQNAALLQERPAARSPRIKDDVRGDFIASALMNLDRVRGDGVDIALVDDAVAIQVKHPVRHAARLKLSCQGEGVEHVDVPIAIHVFAGKRGGFRPRLG